MTQSEAIQQSWPARFSDGQSAKSWPCTVHIEARGLAIDRGAGHDVLLWPYSALRSHTMLRSGSHEAIVENDDASGAQLFIRDAAFIGRLARVAPQLSARAGRRRWLLPLLAVTAAIAGLVAVAWHYNVRPAQAIARTIPDSARQSLGRSVIAQFTANSKTCSSPAGRAALDALMTRILQGVPDAHLYKISVIDLPIVNAFAVPGGQMVITEKLIQSAQGPDEVAGILAHEIGHGLNRHPEAGLIRAFGLSFILDLLSGGSSGSLGTLGLLVLQTSYVRQDEAAADDAALALLKRAAISQDGLADFFTRHSHCRRGKDGATRQAGKPSSDCESDSEGNSKSSTFDLLRTHPYPKQRLEAVRNAPRYPATPALAPAQWQALRRICSQ